MNLMQQILEKSTKEMELSLWWIGQSGFFVVLPNKEIILIDPYLSNSIKNIMPTWERMTPVPVQPSDVLCNYIICTHNHIDHLDPGTIKGLHENEINRIIFIGPRNVVKAFRSLGLKTENILLLEAGDELTLNGFRLTGTFCIPNDDSVLDSIGVMITTSENNTILFTGDTAYHKCLDYFKKYRVNAFIPCINGKYGNMDYKNAVHLSETINPQIVIPCHYDMFSENSANPYVFCRRIQQKCGIKCIVPQIGEPIILPNIW